MNSSRRRGFTLVELLVVITIIGMLMALLLPAVNAAREAGRRAQCMNNQKNLSLALLQHESSRGSFPGYINEVGKVAGTDQIVFGTWVVSIFPYIDNMALQDLWSNGKHRDYSSGGDAPGYTNLALLRCPSQPDQATGPGETPCSYRVNAGRIRGTFACNDSSVVSFYGADSTTCGVFDVQSPFFTKYGKLRNSKIAQGSIRDGAATTLLLSENSREATWTREPPPVSTGSPPTPSTANSAWSIFANEVWGTKPYKEDDLGFGVPWIEDRTSFPTEGMEFINRNFDKPDRGIVPACYHGGVVVVSFCDGHQYTLSEDIDVTTYLHLVTPYGKRAHTVARGASPQWPFFKDLDPTYILDEGSY